MNIYWTKGLTGEAKEKRVKEVKAYSKAFRDLEEILKTYYTSKDEFRDYSNPNWMANQIAVNERNAVIKEILDLINLK